MAGRLTCTPLALVTYRKGFWVMIPIAGGVGLVRRIAWKLTTRELGKDKVMPLYLNSAEYEHYLTNPLDGPCPDCGARGGEECSYNCSSNWD